MKIRKIVSVLLVTVMLSSFVDFGSHAVLAQEDITVTVNGNQLSFDQPPIIKDGRMLVPLCAIFEAMGAEVLWI